MSVIPLANIALADKGSPVSESPRSRVMRYVQTLADRPLVEGLGFEGAVTVYDEVRRMHRKLGKPTTRRDLYYRYEGGGFDLEVFGRYVDGRFEVARLRYSGDESRRLRTDSGFRLGDPISRVLESHGAPDVQASLEYTWERRGVTYRVDSTSTIVAISVFRPERRLPVQNTAAPNVAPKEASSSNVQQPKVVKERGPKRMTIADLRLSIPLGGWVVERPVSETGATLVTPEGMARLDITTCQDCKQVLVDAVRDREATLGANVLPATMRRPEGKARGALGVDAAYLGVYPNLVEQTIAWLWALRSQQQGWLITLTVRTNAAHHPEVSLALDVIEKLRVVPPR